MIHITEKRDCCGCSACKQICPKKCIDLKADSEGFLYPTVNQNNCIDCGLCEKVCPVSHPFEKRNPLSVFASYNKDLNVRLQSSSGGVFTNLANFILSKNGVVFGVRFDEEWQAKFDYTESFEGVAAFRSSKYVQAEVGDSYKIAQQFLKEDRWVLFSGTPCQIAGLLHFLRKDYPNLITVDIACHGVPSPKVWNRYLSEVVSSKEQIEDIQFRNKNKGWTNFQFLLKLKGIEKPLLEEKFTENTYMKAFLANLSLRPSCMKCEAKGNSSHSDFTLADFWGIQSFHPEKFDDKGTGLLLVNTTKGENILSLLDLSMEKSSYEEGVKENFPLLYSVIAHPKRTLFFENLDSCTSVSHLILSCVKPTFKQRVRKCLSKVKHFILRKS